jgi:hypothetical protein
MPSRRVRSQREEKWRKAKQQLDRTTLADQSKALRYEMAKQGISVAVAIPRIVKAFLPYEKNPSEDQVRALAASWAGLMGVSEERFVELWRASLRV